MIRLLVAEDDQDLLMVLQTRLEASGFKVETATTGQEALDKIRNSPPDLALLDILLPVKDGYKVVQALRSDPATKELPVVMFSASMQALEEFQKNCDTLKVQGCLPKPFDFQNLVATIRGIVGQPKDA